MQITFLFFLPRETTLKLGDKFSSTDNEIIQQSASRTEQKR